MVRTGYASCASCTALSRTRRLCRNTKSKRQGRGSSVTRALGEGQGEGMGNGGGP